MTASCNPRKFDAGFIARYSRSSVLSTSTMKSPPLELWMTGSCTGGLVPAAVSGAGALAGAAGEAGGAGADAAATAVDARAAAPVRLMLLRKRRRSDSGESWLSLDIDIPV